MQNINVAKHPAAGIISRLAAAFASTSQRLVAPLRPPTTLKGLKATGPFDIAKVVAATLPANFEAFTEEELSEAKRLFEEIRADHQRINDHSEAAVRKEYKRDPGSAGDLPLSARLEQAETLRHAAKQRMHRNHWRASEVLEPGMKRGAKAIEDAALSYAAAEKLSAEKLGIFWEPSSVVRTLAAAAARIRDRSGAAGHAYRIEEATCGLATE